MLTREQIAETIKKLYKAGKKFPQGERVYAVPQEQRMEVITQVVQDTVELIYEFFKNRNISAERWQEIEHEAILLTDNIINPALFRKAMDTIGQSYTTPKSSNPIDVVADKPVQSMLWRWTKAKLSEGRHIMVYMPHESEIVSYMRELNARETVDNKMLVKVFLNDCNYAKEKGKVMQYKAVIDNEQNVRFTKV